MGVAGLVSPPPDDRLGRFRTPTLRNVALTAPYMHGGQLATLADVIAYYDAAGGATPVVGTRDPALPNLSLDSGEKADLVA